MKLTVKTQVLQGLLTKAIKGVSNNKMLPLTSMIAIEVESGFLSLITTDMTNYLSVAEHIEATEDFKATVNAELFSKLISKMTSDEVTLTLNDSILEVKGGGNYKIELMLDENGSPINFPKPFADFKGEHTIIKSTDIKSILESNKASLAQTLENPCYTGYYCGDKVVSTDSYKICGNEIKLFDVPVLITPEMMELLDVFTEENVNVELKDNTLMFYTNSAIVYGTQLEGIEDFQINAINGLLDEEFENNCKVSKKDLLNALDRLSLFVGVYDKNAVDLVFTNDGIVISSKQTTGAEVLPYITREGTPEFSCSIDIENFISQIKVHSQDSVEIHYGKDNVIKIVDGNITKLVALLMEE